MKTAIIPSVLVHSEKELAERLRAVAICESVAQLDVLDNTLLPYESFSDPAALDRLRPEVEFEVHLMVKEVDSAILKWNFPWVKKLIFHLEAEVDAVRVCRQIRALGKLAGIAISPKTEAFKVLPLLDEVDTILVMTVEPGRNGAPFLPQTLEKVKMLRERALNLDIEVDGGVNPQTLKSCLAAGANLFVVGSFLENGRFRERYQELAQVLG